MSSMHQGTLRLGHEYLNNNLASGAGHHGQLPSYGNHPKTQAAEPTNLPVSPMAAEGVGD